MRCAPFGPTPGSWPSSSIRSWTIPSYTSVPARPGLVARACPQLRLARRLVADFLGLPRQHREARKPLEPGHAGQPAGAANSARERAQHLGLNLAERAVRVAERGQHEIGNRRSCFLRIVRLDCPGRDRHVDDLALAADRDFHEPAAGAALDLGVGKLLLSADELAGGGEELLKVELPTGIHSGSPALLTGRASHWLRSRRHARDFVAASRLSEPTACRLPRHAGARVGTERRRSR